MSKPNKRRQAKKKARSESLRKRKAVSVASKSRTIPLEDPFLSERMMRRIALLEGGTLPDTSEGLDASLGAAMQSGRSINDLGLEQVESDPVEMAQELALQGMACELEGDWARADRLFLNALKLDPDCVDARVARSLAPLLEGELLEQADYEDLLALRVRHMERLKTKHGERFWESTAEVLLRPHHRLLAALMDASRTPNRFEMWADLALEVSLLGPSKSMMLRPTLTGLLLGGHFREADELIDFVVKGPSAYRAKDGVLPEFLWWHSWSAFLAGDSQKAKELAFAAEKAFPDSSLAILVETKEDDDRLFASAYYDENTEMFADLMDAFIIDNPFHAAARQWFGMEQEAGAPG